MSFATLNSPRGVGQYHDLPVPQPAFLLPLPPPHPPPSHFFVCTMGKVGVVMKGELKMEKFKARRRKLHTQFRSEWDSLLDRVVPVVGRVISAVDSVVSVVDSVVPPFFNPTIAPPRRTYSIITLSGIYGKRNFRELH